MGVVFTHVTFPGLWGKVVMRAAGFAVHLWYLIVMAETYGLWLFISKHRWQQMVEMPEKGRMAELLKMIGCYVAWRLWACL